MGAINNNGVQKIQRGVRFSDATEDYVPVKKPGKGRVVPEHKRYSFAPRSAEM